MNAEETRAMITRLRQGDQKELARVYRRYRLEFVQWLVSMYGCDEAIAKDVYQNTIMTFSKKVMEQSIPDLSASLKSYLFGIGKNKYYEYRKAQRRFEARSSGSQSQALTVVEKENAAEEERCIQAMKACLDFLGDPCKSLLQLYYFHNMSMEDIKNALEYKNSNTVKNIKYKCLTRLRKLFTEKISIDSNR